MHKRKSIISDLIGEQMSLGFNKSQATSLAWAIYFEDWMSLMAARSRSFFGPEIRIDCFCHDCKDGGQLLPDTTQMWIKSHKDHKTKTIKLR